MPDYLINDARFPGVTSVLRGTYTVGHGTAPGRAVLTIPPTRLDQIAEVGDLVFSDGTRQVVLKDCKVVAPSYEAGPSGQTESLVIEDRRFRWRMCGAIHGRYNVIAEAFHPIPPVAQALAPQGNAPVVAPIPPGEEPIRPETKKTAPELARLCLEAMGERDYDVSALDPKATPVVDWDAINPAQALNQLVEPLGCRVVFRPVQNNVLIARLGEGAELPEGSFLDNAPGFDVKAKPARIRLFGRMARYQMRFALEAVGLDLDDTFQPLDRLSYKPPGGWTETYPPDFGNLPWGTNEPLPRPGGTLPAGFTQEDARSLAKRSVYRCYRIKLTGADGTGKLKVPPDGKNGPGVIRDIRLIRLLPVKNLTGTDPAGRKYQAPASCYGVHFPPEAFRLGKDVLSLPEHTNASTPVRVPFTIDQEHSLITFSQYVYYWSTTKGKEVGAAYPADLVLECACEAADPRTFQWLRYFRDLQIPNGLENRIAIMVKEDVRYEVVAEYGGPTFELRAAGANRRDDNFNTFKKTTDNEKQIRGRADYYLAGESQKYLTGEVGQRNYSGIVPIDPDGAIQQVTYSISPAGPQTTASRNSEHDIYLPNYQQRRDQEVSTLENQRRFGDALVELDRRFGGPLAGPVSVRG